MQRAYAPWVQRYSNEDFDRKQRLASELAQADQKAGRMPPPEGYFDRAADIVNRANIYSAGHAGPVEY